MAIAHEVWERSQRRAAANGAIMRTSVLGLLLGYDGMPFVSWADDACRLTHADPRYVASCVALVKIISLLVIGVSDINHVLNLAADEASSMINRYDRSSRMPLRVDWQT